MTKEEENSPRRHAGLEAKIKSRQEILLDMVQEGRNEVQVDEVRKQFRGVSWPNPNTGSFFR